jgi:hypothetical protein
MLRLHRPLLDELARDLEQRGFIAETELAQRLEDVRSTGTPTSI